MPTKIEMLVIYEKMSPSTMVTWRDSHVTNKYISIFTWFLAINLDKVITCGIGLLYLNRMVLWSRDYI